LIPGLIDTKNQLRKIAEFIAKELSAEIPWHISKFTPETSYKMQNCQATSPKLIDQAYQFGKNAGLKYIYVGNVRNDERENTYCPKCLNLVIERKGYQIDLLIKQGKCPKCQFKLPLKIN